MYIPANTLNVGLLEKKVTSDQIIKIDMVHEIPAANRNSKGLNKHFQYHSIVGLNLNKKYYNKYKICC